MLYDFLIPYPMYHPLYLVQTQPISFSQDPNHFGSSTFLTTSVVEEICITKKRQSYVSLKKTQSHVPPKPPKDSTPESQISKNYPRGVSPSSWSNMQVFQLLPFFKRLKSMDNNMRESPYEEVFIPNFMMHEPTVVEEEVMETIGNFSED
ncbi:unnamed protein product, partial [Brassica rapa subsp. trilocularis]